MSEKKILSLKTRAAPIVHQLVKAKHWLGLAETPTWFVAVGAVLWLLLFLSLFAGVVGTVWSAAFQTLPDTTEAFGGWRMNLIALAGMTATLGVVVALPITLNRVRLTREANETAKDSLFNAQITEAAADLYAQRQVTIEDPANGDQKINGWEDDIIRRNAAIDRLEGLVKERQSEAERVSRLLSVYVRELSGQDPAAPHTNNPTTRLPDTGDPFLVHTRDRAVANARQEIVFSNIDPEPHSLEALKTWAKELKPIRSDMENAVQVLGRLTEILGVEQSHLQIDLLGANLQGFDLHRLRFPDGVRLHKAEMQGANFSEARMREADFSKAKMQGAILNGSHVSRANFIGAQMQGVDLGGAQMEKAEFQEALMQGVNFLAAQMRKTDFGGAQMRGANLLTAEMQGARFSRAQLQDADFTGAQLKGALFLAAQVRGANFRTAALQGADFSGAQMQKADLREAQMQGAKLLRAQMQGANLGGTQWDEATDLRYTNLRGSALRNSDQTSIAQLKPFWADVFADGTVQVPEGERPAHWVAEELEESQFKKAWRAWQRSIGMDPNDPK
ncbi:MAG: pentapeptide repeat-containing protein [Paracoccaceae bacterium]|nr:pentapeptide repeat-containing protein [Paracoccaceae bacterium]